MFTSDDESKAFISDDMNLVVILDLAVGDPFTLKLLLHTDVIACLAVGNVNAWVACKTNVVDKIVDMKIFMIGCIVFPRLFCS